MTTTRYHSTEPLQARQRRWGYAISIIANAMMLWVVAHLLEWDVVPFLTPRFAEVSLVIMVAIGTTMAVDGYRLLMNQQRAASLVSIVVGAVNLIATLRLLEVFPFDFTRYSLRWDVVAKTVLVIAAIGTLVGMLHDATKYIGSRL